MLPMSQPLLHRPVGRRSTAGRLAAGAVVAGLLLVASACGNDDDTGAADTTAETAAAPDTTTDDGADDTTTTDTTTTEAPETTTTEATTTTTEPEPEPEPEPTPVRFDELGPFPIGVTTFEAEGRTIEVWYPAVEGTDGVITYDVRDFTPEAIQALLEGDANASFSHPGARDVEVAEVAEGGDPFPVVLFSHGSSGMRLQSSFLTSHLASHGMVVVAPDHPSRDLRNALGGRTPEEATDSVEDLLVALDAIVAAGDSDSDAIAVSFVGSIDPGRVAALGHSAGGGTVLRAAADPRIGSYVSMAAGGPGEEGEFPDVPSFFMAGETDEIVTPTERTRPAFEAAPAPSWYLEIAETGHNGFDDFCTFGGGTGIVGVAEAAGLGAVLDAQPQLRRLGEDGCIPPAAPVEQAFPIIRHATVAFLRWAFDTDADADVVGLDADTLSGFELEVVSDRR